MSAIKRRSRKPLVASFADAFKSWLARERRFWSAHVKVDYDRAPRWVPRGRIRRMVFPYGDPRPAREPMDEIHVVRTLVRVPGNPLRVRDLRALRAEADRRGIRFCRVIVHRTRKGHHLRCYCAGLKAGRDWLPARTTLALQAAAGDDPVRQRFNRGRVRRGEAGYNVMWNAKWSGGVESMRETIDVEWTKRARRILT